MVNRVERILLELMSAKGPTTSARLAEVLGISSRTVKSTMPQVARELERNGAELVSLPHRGYEIAVHDRASYDEFLERVKSRSIHIAMAGYDDTSRLLYIGRKLVAAPAGAKVDEICDDLCLSRSAVARPLARARSFCESFHLTVSSTPGGGINVFGDEHMVRLAMVELFEVHFHKHELDETDREYARWIGCAYQERQDIRHDFLKTLRESGISLRDSATQRTAMYLIIARNRVRAGLGITLPQAWIEEIRCTPYHQLAGDIIESLAESFEGFEFNGHEVAFLGIWLLRNHDANTTRPLAELAPFLADEVIRATAAVAELVSLRTGVDFLVSPEARELLQHILLSMVAARRYEMDGTHRFDYVTERVGLKSSLAVSFGTEFAQALAEVVGYRSTISDVLVFTDFVLAVLSQVELPVRPLRLLATSGQGPAYARIEAERLRQFFPKLIASVRACELYEIRGYDPNDYDGVLTDVDEYGYNYDYPKAVLRLDRQSLDFGTIHDELLVQAFDLDRFLPAADTVRIYLNVEAESIPQLLGMLKLMHSGQGVVEQLVERLLRRNDAPLDDLSLVVRHRCLIVVAPAHDLADEFMDLYRLHTPVRWHDAQISSTLFCVFDFSGPDALVRTRVLERMLYLFPRHVTAIDGFANDPMPFIRALAQESMKLFTVQ